MRYAKSKLCILILVIMIITTFTGCGAKLDPTTEAQIDKIVEMRSDWTSAEYPYYDMSFPSDTPVNGFGIIQKSDYIYFLYGHRGEPDVGYLAGGQKMTSTLVNFYGVYQISKDCKIERTTGDLGPYEHLSIAYSYNPQMTDEELKQTLVDICLG